MTEQSTPEEIERCIVALDSGDGWLLNYVRSLQAQLAAMTAERDDWKRFALLMDKCRRTMWRQVEEERMDAAGVPRLKLEAALREIAEGAEHWHDNGSDEERSDVLQGIGGMARTALEGGHDDK